MKLLIMQRFFYLNLFFIGIIIAGYAQPVKGVVQLKIAEELEAPLQQALLRTSATQLSATTPLSVGIQRLDALNKRYKVMKMRRIFPDAGEYEDLHREEGLHLWYEMYFDNAVEVNEVVRAYKSIPEMQEVAPVYPIKQIGAVMQKEDSPAATSAITPLATSDDPYLDNQWHYNNDGVHGMGTAGADIRLATAWDTNRGNAGVIVAVVDGGIDYTHPDLADNMWRNIGKNFVTAGHDVTPEDHGTHVAGVISAVSNNSAGVAGIAGGSGNNDGVRLMSCQIFEGDDNGDSYRAIIYAADSGAVVCQNSWGYTQEGVYNPSDSVAIKYFIKNAGKKKDGTPRPGTKMVGGIVIFAAGNSNSSGRWYPAYYNFVTSVSAVSSQGKKAYYSNYGPWIDIAAPGGDFYNGGGAGNKTRAVLSTIPVGSSYQYKLDADPKYGYMQGTSMACPHVSGVAALILSQFGHEGYTPDSLSVRLLGSVRSLASYDPANATTMGKGLLDAGAALGPFIYVSDITISNCPSNTLTIGNTRTLNVMLSPDNAFDKRITWSSSNADVATINQSGVLTAINEGVTTITVKSMDGKGVSTSCAVNVMRVLVTGVEFVYTHYDVVIGDVITLRANVIPSNATIKTLSWSSDNSNIASVDANGIVTARAQGQTNIRVRTTDGNFEAACTVTVIKPVTGVSLNPRLVNIKTGSSAQLEAIVEPADAANKNVIWHSSDASIATVDANGKITGVKGGPEGNPKKADIKVFTENGGFEATAQVNVYENIYAPVAFSPNNDGINDYFEFVLDSRDTYTLSVFDKSGQIYYQSENYKNDWEGTANVGHYSGKKVPAGTYFYTLKSKSGETKSGYVVIKY